MKIKAAVVGATGIAGQQVLAALDGHPYFEIAAWAASERSAGKAFAEAITDAMSGVRRWYVGGCEPPAEALGLEVQDAETLRLGEGARPRGAGREAAAPWRDRLGICRGRVRARARAGADLRRPCSNNQHRPA